jgi:hypothetical protein
MTEERSPDDMSTSDWASPAETSREWKVKEETKKRAALSVCPVLSVSLSDWALNDC